MPKFQLGKLVMTTGATKFDPSILRAALVRHASGDWGDICEEDRELNDEATELGNRVLSVYNVDGEKLWIITEADRSVTTFLLPEEY